MQSVFESFDPTDTEEALAQLRAARTRLGELVEVAPSDAESALLTEIDFIRALITILETVDPNDPAAVVAAVNGLRAQRDAAESAARELQSFEARECTTTTSAP